MASLKDFLLAEDKLKEVALALCEPFGKTIGTNINKGVQADFQSIICHTIGEAIKYESMEYILVNGSMSGAIQGGFHFLVPTGEALNVAGSMMAMSGDELLNFTSKGYDAEAEDAFKEVVSQVVGQSATVLRAMFQDASGSVSTTKNINLIEHLKELEAELEGDEFVWLQFKMMIQDEEPFVLYFILSKELAFSMAPLEGAENIGVDSKESESLGGASSEESLAEKELLNNIETVRRIKVPLIVTLAQKRLTVEDALKQISVGSIIEFDVPFDSYLELSAGNRKIGEGEVVTVSEFYGLLVKSVLSPKETLESLM